MKEIGKVVSVHGVDGDVVISHCIANQHSIRQLKVLMIEVWNQSYIPFFIENIRGVSNEDMIIKFEDIDSREEAKKFLNRKVYVYDERGIHTNSEEEWGYLAGFAIKNQDGVLIGKVDKVISYGIQMLIELTYDGKAIHLPLHTDLIIKIEKDNSVLHLTIPEGLLSL